MTIRGDKRKTAQQRTEARWSVIVDRDKVQFSDGQGLFMEHGNASPSAGAVGFGSVTVIERGGFIESIDIQGLLPCFTEEEQIDVLSSSSSDIPGDLLERERQFSSAREMDGGGGEGERRLLRCAVQQMGVTGGRELVQSEGIGEPWGRCWLREGPELRWM